MFSWTLQAEVPGHYHGNTRFPVRPFLLVLCRKRKHKENSKSALSRKGHYWYVFLCQKSSQLEVLNPEPGLLSSPGNFQMSKPML